MQNGVVFSYFHCKLYNGFLNWNVRLVRLISKGKKMRKKAFTLIELLVVIAIIALLLSILLPSLQLAKDKVKRINCSANLRSLAMAAILYAEDNSGLTPCSTVGWSEGPGWVGRTCEQLSGEAFPIDEQITAIENGQLYKYIKNTKGWRCPEDPDREQLRSYGMAAEWWGAYTTSDNSITYDPGAPNGIVYRKIENIKLPSKRFIFMDSQGKMRDGYFALWYSQFLWWNIPNINHGGGSVNGFADAHTDYYKLGQETIDNAEIALAGGAFGMPQTPPETEEGIEDLVYYQRATWATSARAAQ
jgi:prepilin-type N-terminal cleavage/methylation domain-containing protein